MYDTPKAGEAVFIKFHHGDHVFRTAVAIVLAVNPSAAEGEPPTLSLIYMQPNASHRNLIGPTWEREFRRATGVKHHSHPDVRAGQEAITWGGQTIDANIIESEAPESLNARPADPSERNKRPVEPEALQVSRQQLTQDQGKAILSPAAQPTADSLQPVIEEEIAKEGLLQAQVEHLKDELAEEKASQDPSYSASGTPEADASSTLDPITGIPTQNMAGSDAPVGQGSTEPAVV